MLLTWVELLPKRALDQMRGGFVLAQLLELLSQLKLAGGVNLSGTRESPVHAGKGKRGRVCASPRTCHPVLLTCGRKPHPVASCLLFSFMWFLGTAQGGSEGSPGLPMTSIAVQCVLQASYLLGKSNTE